MICRSDFYVNTEKYKSQNTKSKQYWNGRKIKFQNPDVEKRDEENKKIKNISGNPEFPHLCN
jgi:glutaredoxin